jgi:hypothetical protein
MELKTRWFKMRGYDVSIVFMIWPGPAGELGVDGGHRGARKFPLCVGDGVDVAVAVGGHLHTLGNLSKSKIPMLRFGWLGRLEEQSQESGDGVGGRGSGDAILEGYVTWRWELTAR